MNRLWEMKKLLKTYWHWIWSGYPNKTAARRAIECDAVRFGGRITWRD